MENSADCDLLLPLIIASLQIPLKPRSISLFFFLFFPCSFGIDLLMVYLRCKRDRENFSEAALATKSNPLPTRGERLI